MTSFKNALAIALLALAGGANSQDIPDQIVERVTSHDNRVLLIGEVHGTAEVPAQVAELAARMLEGGKPLIVGLEIWRGEQKRIDAYLASAGGDADRQRLLAGPFWQREYQDGRSSVAMAGLLESLRVLALKSKLTVIAMDADPYAQLSEAGRDLAMAERIQSALKAKPKARALILAGNFHTRIQGSAPWDPDYKFMGYHLLELHPYALEIMGVSGSAWICTGGAESDCKARELQESGKPPGLELGDVLNDRSHHGIWWIAGSTASTPAKDSH